MLRLHDELTSRIHSVFIGHGTACDLDVSLLCMEENGGPAASTCCITPLFCVLCRSWRTMFCGDLRGTGGSERTDNSEPTALTSPPPIPLLPPPLLLCSKVMKPKRNPYEAAKPAGNESRPPIWTPDDNDSSVNRTELA